MSVGTLTDDQPLVDIGGALALKSEAPEATLERTNTTSSKSRLGRLTGFLGSGGILQKVIVLIIAFFLLRMFIFR